MQKLLDLAHVQKHIQILKSFDLRSVSMDEIRKHLFEIKDHIGTRRIYPKGTVVCRSLRLKDNDDIFTTEERISYNKNTNGMAFGRATYEETTAFYGSLNTAIVNCDATSAFEILPHSTDDKIERYNIVSGKWVMQRDMDLFFIGGGGNLLHLCDDGVSRHNLLYDYIRQDKSNIIILKIIDTFLCDEFSKVVDPNTPWNYKISACYSEILKEKGEVGVVYPSVKSNGAGLNIVLFPPSVDKGLIKLERAFYGTHYNRKGEYINEYNLLADIDDGILRWREDYAVLKPLPNFVKKYYSGLTTEKPQFLKYANYTDIGVARI
jgi:hypothetical protein